MRQSFRLWWNRDQSQCWCTFWHEACTVSFALFCRFFRVSRVHNPFNQIPKSDFFCCYMCACMLSTCYRNLFFYIHCIQFFFYGKNWYSNTYPHTLTFIDCFWMIFTIFFPSISYQPKAKRNALASKYWLFTLLAKLEIQNYLDIPRQTW